MKIISLSKYLKEKKKEPICPKCKCGMVFDCNVCKGNMYNIPFRKGHDDAIFECESCRRCYVVLDYTDKVRGEKK